MQPFLHPTKSNYIIFTPPSLTQPSPHRTVRGHDGAQAEGGSEGMHVEDRSLRPTLLLGPGQLPCHLHQLPPPAPPHLPGHSQG